MPASFRVAFAASALSDLEEVCEWYSSKGAPEVGARLAAEVIERSEQLAVFPASGRVVPEFDTVWLRELLHPPLRSVYRVEGERVVVVRVWRSERLLQEPV